MKLTFHGNQPRGAFQNMNSLMNKATMRLCVVVIQIKLEAVLRHYDCENEEPKIRTSIHKLAMIKFYVLVSGTL